MEARKSSNPGAQRSKTLITISQLVASRSLALRRNDMATADQLEKEIIELGGDPSTGQFADAPSVKEDYDAKIQRINEQRAKKNKESMAAAHIASMKRKKAEEAIIKARQYVYPLVHTDDRANPTPPPPPQPIAPPAGGLKKGETPQQYVARTIDLDLGDF